MFIHVSQTFSSKVSVKANATGLGIIILFKQLCYPTSEPSLTGREPSVLFSMFNILDDEIHVIMSGVP